MTNVGVFREYGPHGKHFGARTKLKAMAKGGSSVEGGPQYIGSNLVLYPNSLMIDAPEHLEFWTLWPEPDTAPRCAVTLRFLLRREIIEDQIDKRFLKRWETREEEQNERAQ